jgi:quinohemoprotein ethanol dehydrogenase
MWRGRRRSAFVAMATAGLAVALLFVATADRRWTSMFAQQADADWPFHGNDLGNMRYQDIDLIDRSNVHQLVPLWIFHTGLFDQRSSFEVSPLVVNGVMYITTGHDDIYALNAATGDQIWAYHPLSEMPPLETLSICCGRDNRGVAYANGKVFIGRLDAVLVALDAATGKVIWKSTVADVKQKFTVTMAPQVVDGKVIVGVSGGEFEVRGRVMAFDADSGKPVWTFFTVPPAGRSAPTWAGSSWQHGGGPVWTTPAVDPALGLVYITTGNASPDLNGSRRSGDNLYTSSIVALDIATGEHRWHFQEVHHDIWDYDGPQPPILFTLTRDGVEVPAISHCNKSGEHFILNRRDGTPLHEVTETAVPTEPAWQHPSPTQPVSSVERLTPIDLDVVPPGLTPAPRFTPPQATPLLIQPGVEAGCEWPPAAYSPRTGFVYYGTRYEPNIFVSTPDNTDSFGSDVTVQIPGVQPRGIFGAVDTVTGRIAWRTDIRQPARSGVVVAGDLVFFGQDEGTFSAYDAATGQVLWSFAGTSIQNGGGANAAPIAFSLDGREYIANAFGGNANERNRLVSPLGDALVVFGLPDPGYKGPHVVQAGAR